MMDRFGSKLLGVGTAVAVATVFAFAAPNTANAQVSVGPQATYSIPSGGDGDFGAGVRVNYAIPGAEGFGLSGSVNNYFVEGADLFDVWELNAGGTYAFAMEGSVSPYVGAGLNRQESPGFGLTGLNLQGGAQFGSEGGITPFVEGRYWTTGLGGFNITGGILF